MEIPKLYKKYHVDKEYTSIGLFRALKKKYEIKKVFYPGSHVHITPSLVFSHVVYADSFRNTYRFFEEETTMAYLLKHREYLQEPLVKFYQQDYRKPFNELKNDFDLIISQYAGFVGQAVKPYLKPGGLLVCNNSHGDATMASIDSEYKLVGVYNRVKDEVYRISDQDLETYLIPKKEIEINKELLLQTMKGVAYTKSPSGYIFEKLTG